MTPSLLPRPTATQVMASTLVAMTMYNNRAIIQGTIGAIRRSRRSGAGEPDEPRTQARWIATVIILVVAAGFTPVRVVAVRTIREDRSPGRPAESLPW